MLFHSEKNIIIKNIIITNPETNNNRGIKIRICLVYYLLIWKFIFNYQFWIEQKLESNCQLMCLFWNPFVEPSVSSPSRKTRNPCLWYWISFFTLKSYHSIHYNIIRIFYSNPELTFTYITINYLLAQMEYPFSCQGWPIWWAQALLLVIMAVKRVISSREETEIIFTVELQNCCIIIELLLSAVQKYR